MKRPSFLASLVAALALLAAVSPAAAKMLTIEGYGTGTYTTNQPGETPIPAVPNVYGKFVLDTTLGSQPLPFPGFPYVDFTGGMVFSQIYAFPSSPPNLGLRDPTPGSYQSQSSLYSVSGSTIYMEHRDNDLINFYNELGEYAGYSSDDVYDRLTVTYLGTFSMIDGRPIPDDGNGIVSATIEREHRTVTRQYVTGVGFNEIYATRSLFASLDGTFLDISDDAPVDAPEPAALALFGLGLAGIGAVRRKRRS